MKKIGYILFLLIVLTGCKQENYLDWKALNEAWLEHNKTQPGVITTSSGLQYKQLPPLAARGKRCGVQYVERGQGFF